MQRNKTIWGFAILTLALALDCGGNRWLKADGSVLTNMDWRYGPNKVLKPGEVTGVPLLVTGPKDPGECTLEVDRVEEGVGWFSEKGSATAKVKVTVVK